MNVSLYLKEHTVALKVPVGILKRNIGNQFQQVRKSIVAQR